MPIKTPPSVENLIKITKMDADAEILVRFGELIEFGDHIRHLQNALKNTESILAATRSALNDERVKFRKAIADEQAKCKCDDPGDSRRDDVSYRPT